ncbi:MAG: phospho-N-acetylmuramoyl-pentapeptide-transferase [Candidatus Faecousia sp.]|nr:phospho-N-acetylmuramoyl-pentapeptide-transferase [Clostridiales bacterium]MCI6935839.1 phospho-N-acetylmuramoyl-pentapeptide-transferase [Clostridiales bacterium]MDD5882675.1 phospho-N-acetylmuramoyl-pentapeptide-transferase [Bacillota bacterium]MDY4599605.1 phospho-N-acetylmuramoyl-pentapeptide-transferase [Candidatus Faecousia sp.]
MTRVLITGVVGCALSWALGHFLLPVLHALKAGASIREIGPTWHNNKTGTPIMGGLMFIFASILCLVGNLPSMTDYSVFFVLALALCFGFIGFLDDFTKVRHHRNLGLTSAQKAMLQMAVSAVFLYAMYKAGAMDTHLYIPFWNKTFYLHPIVYIFFAMFVMVGCVNSVNLTDGVDGLSSSVTLPVMVFFTAASIALGKYDLALLPASLVGGLLAYLTYNWHPAKVFMGDTGSLFLGGVVCAMAFALEMPLILILVGFVYICETMSDILQITYFKLTHGKRLFKMAPIHHHFEMCGWKEEKIVLSFAGVSAIMCILAWFGISGLVG